MIWNGRKFWFFFLMFFCEELFYSESQNSHTIFCHHINLMDGKQGFFERKRKYEKTVSTIPPNLSPVLLTSSKMNFFSIPCLVWPLQQVLMSNELVLWWKPNEEKFWIIHHLHLFHIQSPRIMKVELVLYHYCLINWYTWLWKNRIRSKRTSNSDLFHAHSQASSDILTLQDRIKSFFAYISNRKGFFNVFKNSIDRLNVYSFSFSHQIINSLRLGVALLIFVLYQCFAQVSFHSCWNYWLYFLAILLSDDLSHNLKVFCFNTSWMVVTCMELMVSPPHPTPHPYRLPVHPCVY